MPAPFPKFSLRYKLGNILKLVITSTILTAFCLTLSITGASHLAVKPLRFSAPDASPIDADISLAVEILSADPISRTFVADWFPGVHCAVDRFAIADIYVNPGFLDSSSPSFTVLPPFSPAFQLNKTALCLGYLPIYPSFRTVSKLAPADGGPLDIQKQSSSTMQNYPFDIYFTGYFLYALNNETGIPIPLNVTQSFGIAVNFDVTLLRTFVTGPEQRVYVSLRMARSKATQMFVVMIAITNWFIAIAFIMICASTWIYHSHTIYAEMFVLPVGAVFSLTTVRANLPGAPAGFGATIGFTYSIDSLCTARL